MSYALSIRAVHGYTGPQKHRLDFAYSAIWYNVQEAQLLPSGERRPLTGTPAQIADDIKRYADLGVCHMMLNLAARYDTTSSTADQAIQPSLARMERFAPRIMPHV